MKYCKEMCKILVAEETAAGFFDVTVSATQIASVAKPGQFVHILVPGHTLRRPISICDINPKEGTIRIVYEIRGPGTKRMAALQVNDLMDMIGPLGKGFDIADPTQNAVFVGGGVGTPPLLAASKTFGKNAAVLLGFRSKSAVILQKDFINNGAQVQVATDDGTMGHHGFVTDLLKESIVRQMPDIIYACGPSPMLKIIAAVARENHIRCQVSMEERMACGVGACLVCACKARHNDGSMGYRHVCKDGPVFEADNIIFD